MPIDIIQSVLANPAEKERFDIIIEAWNLALLLAEDDNAHVNQEYMEFKIAYIQACEIYKNGYNGAIEMGLDDDAAASFALSLSADARMEALELGLAKLEKFTEDRRALGF